MPSGRKNFLSVPLSGPRKEERESETAGWEESDVAFLAVKLNFISPQALYNEINIKFPFVHQEFCEYICNIYVFIVKPTS